MKRTRSTASPNFHRHSTTPAAAKFQPFPIRRILVPVDFSEAGRSAIEYAKALAVSAGAEICLVHVLQRIYSAPEFDYIQLDSGRMRDLLRRKLAAMQRTQFQGIKTEHVIRTGFPFEEIVDTAHKSKADIIVMAPHGHAAMQHFFLGSTTERVVRRAECPVLVVRSNGSPNPSNPKNRQPTK